MKKEKKTQQIQITVDRNMLSQLEKQLENSNYLSRASLIRSMIRYCLRHANELNKDTTVNWGEGKENA